MEQTKRIPWDIIVTSVNVFSQLWVSCKHEYNHEFPTKLIRSLSTVLWWTKNSNGLANLCANPLNYTFNIPVRQIQNQIKENKKRAFFIDVMTLNYKNLKKHYSKESPNITTHDSFKTICWPILSVLSRSNQTNFANTKYACKLNSSFRIENYKIKDEISIDNIKL